MFVKFFVGFSNFEFKFKFKFKVFMLDKVIWKSWKFLRFRKIEFYVFWVLNNVDYGFLFRYFWLNKLLYVIFNLFV